MTFINNHKTRTTKLAVGNRIVACNNCRRYMVTPTFLSIKLVLISLISCDLIRSFDIVAKIYKSNRIRLYCVESPLHAFYNVATYTGSIIKWE